MSVRQYKSNVFAMLMEVKDYALEVYNLLNETDYNDADLVEIKKLNSGVMLSVRNDASFLLDSYMNLYEHQSTYNPNMPLRFLIYFSGIIQDIVSENEYDIFGKKRIPLPTPKFLVFYNGVEERPENETMKLSDAFIQKDEIHQLELTCQVININPGKNDNIVAASKVLSGYRYFVETVRKYICEKAEIKDAVRMAIDDCIRNDILGDFFKTNRKEVEEVAVLDFTFERREELIRRDSYEEGKSTGIEEGRSIGIEEGRSIGIEEGKSIGIEEGRSIGIEEGRSIGIEEGKSIGIEEGRSIGIEEGKSIGIVEGINVLFNAVSDIKAGRSVDECIKEYGKKTVDMALKI